MKFFNEDGTYTREFQEYRWNLIIAIHKQGIKACSSCVGVAGIAVGKGKQFLTELEKLQSLVLEFNTLEEAMLADPLNSKIQADQFRLPNEKKSGS